jgi:hypothetical protein
MLIRLHRAYGFEVFLGILFRIHIGDGNRVLPFEERTA